MKPASIPADEEARLEALDRYQILDTLPEVVYDDLTRLAAFVCEVPISLVSLIGRDRQWFKSRVGLDVVETHRDLAFCAHAILDQRMLVVPDATQDDRFAGNPLVTGEPDIRFYAGTPLVSPSGHALGTLCVIDRKPRELSSEQLDMLQALGRQVVSQLELRASLLEQAEAEAALRRAMREAKDANRAKSTFLANMSHELRTPLNSVIGFTNVLLRNREERLTEDELTYLERIRENGKHLLALINDVLDLSKIEAGRLDLTLEPVDLEEFLPVVVGALEGTIDAQGVTFRLEIEPPLKPVRCDRLRLNGVLNNLIGNALRFAAHGTVALRVVKEPGTSNPLRIDVVDSGIGISPETRTKIFESFVQADGSTARRFGGTGLGLAIARALCRAMNFDLVVASEAGAGSTFSILLDSSAPRPKHETPA
jgi:signal transduction histidine kinase